MLPQIAAGNNLNLPIIGGILRGAGAIFMRRSFMKNKIYSAVFFEYIRSLMIRGSSIEFFPEEEEAEQVLVYRLDQGYYL